MTLATETEGVIKFTLDFRLTDPMPRQSFRGLDSWRSVLYRLSLTGVDPDRYGGLAYGNVSQRTGQRSFIISGSQTGGLPCLDAAHYCEVDDWSLDDFELKAHGPTPPSSESLTHAAIYEAASDITTVLHVHSPDIWLNAARLRLPTTPPDIAYGTQEMALAAACLIKPHQPTIIVMNGHQDGVLATGADAETAALGLIRTLAESLSSP